MRNAVVVTAFAALCPSPLYAQSWLPDAGQGAVSVIFQDTSVKQHLFSDGQAIDAGHIDSHNVMLDVTYGLTGKIALGVSLPYIAARYDGSRPHPGSLLDDGLYHGTMQDFRFSVRYGLVTGGTTITPFADLIMPSHDYHYYGHAAPGRRLTELQLGAGVGHVFDHLPALFVQGRYGFGFVEEPLGTSHNRSMLDAEIGYFVSPRLRVLALTASQYTHGGLPLTAQFPATVWWVNGSSSDVPELPHHDQLARSNPLMSVGRTGSDHGATRPVRSYMTTVFGESVHC